LPPAVQADEQFRTTKPPQSEAHVPWSQVPQTLQLIVWPLVLRHRLVLAHELVAVQAFWQSTAPESYQARQVTTCEFSLRQKVLACHGYDTGPSNEAVLQLAMLHVPTVQGRLLS
jgi:hypothetical protein